MTVIDHLRDATRSLHDEFEGSLKVGAAEATVQDYVRFLAALYGWLEPVEGPLWHAAWEPEVRADRRRNKVAWLASDLQALGLSPAQVRALPRCGSHPRLDSDGARFGLAYVLEGSMLDGQALLTRYTARNPRSPRPRYLRGYGQDTHWMWVSFLRAMNRRQDPTFVPAAVEAARRGFESLRGWSVSQGIVRCDAEVEHRSAPSGMPGS